MLEGELKLNRALERWKEWPVTRQPKLLTVFTQGLNHVTGLISDGENRFVLKLFSQVSPLAIKVQNFASKHHLAPQIVYANADSTLCLSRFIEVETLKKKAIGDSLLPRLGKTLSRLHQLSDNTLFEEIGEFDFNQFCSNYLSTIDLDDCNLATMHQRLIPILDHYVDDQTRKAFCHNDLVIENCFSENSRVLFVDWEFAQLNNPWFDLAAIINYFELNLDSARILLKHYHHDYLALVNTPIYYSSQCAHAWIDVLWHLAHKNKLGQSDLTKKTKHLTTLIARFDHASNSV